MPASSGAGQTAAEKAGVFRPIPSRSRRRPRSTYGSTLEDALIKHWLEEA